MAREVDEQEHERDADEDRDDQVAARQEAERDAVVARVDELHAGQQAPFFAGCDRVLDRALAELVEDDDRGGDERRPQPGARRPISHASHRAQPWMMRSTTTLLRIESVMIAMMGLRSKPPNDGSRRRNIRRNGSQTSRRKPRIASLVRE